MDDSLCLISQLGQRIGGHGKAARRRSEAEALVAPTKATESQRPSMGEGLPRRRLRGSRNFLKGGDAGPWATDGLTVVAHQEKAVEEEGAQITLNSLW